MLFQSKIQNLKYDLAKILQDLFLYDQKVIKVVSNSNA